jgi:uncharacterized BrkB/YihY/UPF0761 family membrane protein
VWTLILLLSPTLPAGSDSTNCGTACPHNALQAFSGSPELATALVTTSNIVFTIGASRSRCWSSTGRDPRPRQRGRAMTPLVIVLLASVAEFVVSLFLPAALAAAQRG